jgi:hypothetical protein
MANSGPRKDTFDLPNADRKPENMDKFNSEVDNICKNGIPSASIIRELYKKYPNDEAFVDKVLRACNKSNRKILKLAIKTAKRVRDKHEESGRPMHEILDRLVRYKTDHKWSDMQYNLFIQELGKLLSPSHVHTHMTEFASKSAMDRSRISRALGTPEVSQGKLRIKDSEHGSLNEILSMHDSTLTLYNSAMMTSLMYKPGDVMALTGEFDRKKHNPSNHISAVLVCLYLLKFELLEYHTIYSNMGRIVKCRYEEKPIQTEPDSLLYYDMIVDPNDAVCDTISPIVDIKNRFKVQTIIWKLSQAIRQGMFYEHPASEFITALNACRNNLYDNADLAYNQDEGAILRRFMSVFSLRPILLKTTPLSTLTNYFGNNFIKSDMGGQFNPQPIVTITAISMITVTIPPANVKDADSQRDLTSGLHQTLWLSEGKTIAPKEKSVIYTREMLIFYVNRRYQSFKIRTFINPLHFSQLPLTLNSFSKVNRFRLNVEDIITVGGDNNAEPYELRSVVAVTDMSIKHSGNEDFYITGSIGLISMRRNIEMGIMDNKYYRYDPVGASILIRDEEERDKYRQNKPITEIDFATFADPEEDCNKLGFIELAQTRGTIYIYSKSSGYARHNIEVSVL